MLKSGSLLFVVLALSCVLCGCGLESIPYYNPPVFSISGNNQLTVGDNSNVGLDDDTFKGYEIYYRVYTSEGIAESARTALANYAENNPYDTDGFMTYAENLNFVRVRRKSDSPAPLISPSDDSYYYVNLPSDSDWNITHGSDSSVSVVRSIDATTRRSFYLLSNYSYTSGDADFAGSSDPQSGYLYFVFFAVGYGADTSGTFSTYYGAPTVAEKVFEYYPTQS